MQITKEDVEYPRAAPCGDDRCDLEFAAELTHTVIALRSIGPSRLPCFLIAGRGAEARTNRIAGTRHGLVAGHWSEKPAECYGNGRSIELGT